jgi:hypothetical protein
MTTASQTAWPEGILARYVTVAGVADGVTTVDLAVIEKPHHFPDGSVADRPLIRAACAGCSASIEVSYWRMRRGTIAQWEVKDPQAAERDARDWAQAHAEECRAMARPESA